jgi:membrane-bound lytic murein transglycosylase B
MKQKLLVIPAIALIGLLTYGSVAKADDNQTWHSQMVEQLAAKLGVSEDSVDSAMDEVMEQKRVEREVEREDRFATRLQSFVDEGKLTQAQMDAWLDKQEEWTAEREAEMAAHKEEMQTWFNEQGIDSSLISPMGEGGMRPHMGMM